MENKILQKKLTKWGSGLGVYFDSKDIELFGLVEGDTLDFSDMFLIEVKRKVRK